MRLDRDTGHDRGMGDLKGAEARGEDLDREGRKDADRQGVVIGLSDLGEGVAQDRHCLACPVGQPFAVGRQVHATRAAAEEGKAHAVLQHLDLIGDGGLGHAKLGRGRGEAAVAGGSLEGADGGEGWKSLGHRVTA